MFAQPGVAQIAQVASIPAPIGGINGLDSLMGMPASDSIYTVNMYSSNYGLKVRKGSTEWATNNPGTGGVRTIIPVKSQNLTGGAQDRLFSCTANGIYEITASTAAPTLRVSFGITTGDAGWGAWVNYVTVAGQFIIYTDEENGMYTFEVATNTWLKVTLGGGATQISGVDPATFAHCQVHKNRLWLVQKNTSKGWYQGTGAIYGAATVFDFGNKFVNGGPLVGLYLYTLNTGSGVNAYLVGISGSGDIIAYGGTDVATAGAWDQVGTWFVGDLPSGRRVANSYGGDLVILSVNGAIPISRLLAGTALDDPRAYMTRKILPYISTDLFSSRNVKGWEIVGLPQDNLLMIVVPHVSGNVDRQYVQNASNQGWSIFRDLAIQCTAIYSGEMYFGTTGGKVYRHTGSTDNVTLAGTGAVEINWSLLTSYQNGGAPGVFKIPGMVRTYFIGDAAPSYDVKFKFDYDISEELGAIFTPSATGGLWDVGIWDSAIWGGGLSAFNASEGGYGQGVNLAIALRGKSTNDARLIGFDATYQIGGPF